MKYTISGLTLDGVGSADDSITLQFSISAATGGTPILTFTDDFGVDGGGTQINAGETLAFAFTSGSVLLNAGGDGGMNVLFDGFSAMDANNIATVGNEGFNLTFNSSTTTRNTSDPISFGGLFSTFQVAGITAAQFNTALSRTDGIDSAFSINAFDFRVTVAVPEPSHASLLMLSALGLFRRRRMSLLAR